jgi:AcrR family transcriptional regulator
MPESQKDSKKEAIIQAATEEFISKGYDGARMMEIAKRAGVGHPLLHYHFKTKKELFKKVVQSKMGLLQQSVLVPWDNTGGTFLERLSLTISRHFDFVMGNANYLSFQIEEMGRRPELFNEIKEEALIGTKKMTDMLQKELDKASLRGEIAPTDAIVLLEDIIALNLFFLLIMKPVTSIGLINCDKLWLKKRKEENIRLITNRLTKGKNKDFKLPLDSPDNSNH